MATFSYIPDFSAQMTVRPRVNAVKFGDGYEQRVADGINTQPQSWALTFNNRTDSEIALIEGFLSARGGIEAFDWTTPRGVAGKFVCREWSSRLEKFNVNGLQATFEQVFES